MQIQNGIGVPPGVTSHFPQFFTEESSRHKPEASRILLQRACYIPEVRHEIRSPKCLAAAQNLHSNSSCMGSFHSDHLIGLYHFQSECRERQHFFFNHSSSQTQYRNLLGDKKIMLGRLDMISMRRQDLQFQKQRCQQYEIMNKKHLEKRFCAIFM